MNYWIGVVSHAHVQRGVAGGFAQINHGKLAPLRKMKAGDGLVFYSPRQSHPKGAPLQAFTAIGFIRSGEPYAYDMSAEGVADFVPWRLDVDFVPSQIALIRPLVDQLEFIRNTSHWGSALRFGHLKIDNADFVRIADAMQVQASRHMARP
jgi:hypothetical protein